MEDTEDIDDVDEVSRMENFPPAGKKFSSIVMKVIMAKQLQQLFLTKKTHKKSGQQQQLGSWDQRWRLNFGITSICSF